MTLPLEASSATGALIAEVSHFCTLNPFANRSTSSSKLTNLFKLLDKNAIAENDDEQRLIMQQNVNVLKDHAYTYFVCRLIRF